MLVQLPEEFELGLDEGPTMSRASTPVMFEPPREKICAHRRGALSLTPPFRVPVNMVLWRQDRRFVGPSPDGREKRELPCGRSKPPRGWALSYSFVKQS